MIVATPVLKLRRDEGDVQIPIRLFAPQEDDGAWFCRYEIDWPEDRRSMHAWGEDSVQAIVLALQMIGAELYASDYHQSGNLGLEGPGRGYGFPVPSSLRDLFVGDDLTAGL